MAPAKKAVFAGIVVLLSLGGAAGVGGDRSVYGDSLASASILSQGLRGAAHADDARAAPAPSGTVSVTGIEGAPSPPISQEPSLDESGGAAVESDVEAEPAGFRYVLTSDRGWQWGEVPADADAQDATAAQHRELANVTITLAGSLPGGETLLHRAARLGLSDEVARLMEAGGDPKVADAWGSTPLHAAAGQGHVDATSVLLSRGAPKNQVDAKGRTALFLAAQAGKAKVVALFVHWKAALDKADHEGTSPLAAAIVAANHHEAASALVAAGASVNQANFKGGEGPLFLASKLGDLPLVKQMLATGLALFDQRTLYGQTSVFVATAQKRDEVVSQLLKYGASPDIADAPQLLTPLHVAAKAGSLGLVSILAGAGAAKSSHDLNGQTPLHVAVRANQVAAVALLVSLGAEKSKANKWGATPLHVASRWDLPLAAAEICLHHKGFVDLNKVDGEGRTALFVAAVFGNTEVVRVLVKAGAGVNQAEPTDDLTPLYAAAVGAFGGVASVLVGAGANLDFPDRSRGFTPLHVAASAGFVATVRVICGGCPAWHAAGHGGGDTEQVPTSSVFVKNDYAADSRCVNQADHQRRTPLFAAAVANKLECVEALIACGADLNRDDEDKSTPLYAAAVLGHAEVVRALVKAGAKHNMRLRPSSDSAKGQEVLSLLRDNGYKGAALNEGPPLPTFESKDYPQFNIEY